MMVAVSREGDESSYVLEKIEVVVFRSCLQRPKDVIFEGFVREFGYGVEGLGFGVGERRKKKKKE